MSSHRIILSPNGEKMADNGIIESRLTEKIKEQGGTAERHQARAACRCLNSKFQEAFEDAQLCTMLRPDWEAGWVVLGEAQMGLGHYRASVLAYRKALELKPDDEEVVAAMSVAQAVLQQTQQQKYSSPDSSIRTTP